MSLIIKAYHPREEDPFLLAFKTSFPREDRSFVSLVIKTSDPREEDTSFFSKHLSLGTTMVLFR